MTWTVRVLLLCAAAIAVSTCVRQGEDAAPPTMPTATFTPTAAPPAPTAARPRPTRTPRPLAIQTPVRMFEVKPTPTPEVVVADDSYVEVANDEYYNAFPGLARLDDGTLVAVYRKGVLHARDRGYIVSRRSADGGSTWSEEMVVADNPALDLRDPNIVRLADGSLLVNYFQYDFDAPGTVLNGLEVVHSFDGGETWEAPVSVGTGSYVATSAPILELPGGELLLAYYGSHGGSRYATAYVIRSEDGGQWWLGETIIASGPAYGKPFQEPNLLLLENGHVLATIRSDGERPVIHTSVSKDPGQDLERPHSRLQGVGHPERDEARLGRNSDDLQVEDRAQLRAPGPPRVERRGRDVDRRPGGDGDRQEGRRDDVRVGAPGAGRPHRCGLRHGGRPPPLGDPLQVPARPPRVILR